MLATASVSLHDVGVALAVHLTPGCRSTRWSLSSSGRYRRTTSAGGVSCSDSMGFLLSFPERRCLSRTSPAFEMGCFRRELLLTHPDIPGSPHQGTRTKKNNNRCIAILYSLLEGMLAFFPSRVPRSPLQADTGAAVF